MRKNLNILVEKANAGDCQALEAIVLAIKDKVYNLSLKMLLFPADAEDATQEILIKVITQLSTFNGQSQFTTWVYRIATNYLLTYQGKRSKVFAMPFEKYAELIDTGQSDRMTYARNEGELALLEEEVKMSCTQGLLLCLNAIDRMVYILAEILEFKGVEGAEILEISTANFRQKLSRSRVKIRNFLDAKCGLANPNNPCRCKRKIDFLSDQKIIDRENLRFSPWSNRSIDLVKQIAHLEKSLAIYRSTPSFNAPEFLTEKIKQLIKLT